ncbi:MAG: hypothetical protein WCY62_10745, partial [Clostridia bacterium]
MTALAANIKIITIGDISRLFPISIPGNRNEAAKPNENPGYSGIILYKRYRVRGMEQFSRNCPISDSTVLPAKKDMNMPARGT